MSERHRWVIATLVASAMPAIVTAQDTTALRQRLHRLELLRHTAVVAVARAGSAVIRAEADTVLSNWTGPLLLAEVPAATENARAYVELVTAPSEAVRRCYAGTADACDAALGLLAGDPALQWYDVAERRAL